MKALTGIAVGALAVIGGVVALGICLKKKAEANYEYEEFDNIMDGDDSFDTFFDEDDENLAAAEAVATETEEISEAAAEIVEKMSE